MVPCEFSAETVDAARQIFIDCAKYSKLIKYSELVLKLGFKIEGDGDAGRVGDLCYQISAEELKSGRPALSAVCAGKDGPGRGFYTLLLEFGKIRNSEVGSVVAWAAELSAVYRYWSANR